MRFVHHRTLDEATDRVYIDKYVESCIEYIKESPNILEFDGGKVYAERILQKRGGIVTYATKRGRIEHNNNIGLELDLNIDKKYSGTQKYDVIIATQVISSFVDPISVLMILREMLVEDGLLIITTSGPSYPRIRGQVNFFSKEGLVKVCSSVFTRKNIFNVQSYGDYLSSICMMNYVDKRIFMNHEVENSDYKHDVIVGCLCKNYRNI